ncbi:hypothetical protein DSM25558_3102 [Agrobacterium sp. DSM 25558]|uniref:Uncharacterized protein n=1 Tax=Agrobacterium rosae TaxID=1972867 RepID=A0A1R3U945_9HYPH|nr:hypothetical protein DSM25558_3102 [Agrobacterium sp. DSM 25558]SCX35670.1 hypothetical protein DSM25559_5087 [Agrobacterium rosae]
MNKPLEVVRSAQSRAYGSSVRIRSNRHTVVGRSILPERRLPVYSNTD